MYVAFPWQYIQQMSIFNFGVFIHLHSILRWSPAAHAGYQRSYIIWTLKNTQHNTLMVAALQLLHPQTRWWLHTTNSLPPFEGQRKLELGFSMQHHIFLNKDLSKSKQNC